ncbi:hypothetical protein [Fibrella forsythiae]|uniref:OmpH family outer membrane protein n=1 Tax=Fibrella forsythiae TaxID=2817061 RepID=A0ABS3JCX8_9BACT|nr:hypothetical protein [Fibrella forsythiae]MBO0947296.1 hypothetical protein [Fibrella forsythiae]
MKALVGLMLFLGAASTVSGQSGVPPYLMANPREQVVDLERQLNQYKTALVEAQRQLVDVQALLVEIKATDLALDKKRLQRIDSITVEANRKIEAEYQLRVAADRRATTAEGKLNGVVGRLGLEAATNRFGGFKRRSALKEIIEYAINPKP